MERFVVSGPVGLNKPMQKNLCWLDDAMTTNYFLLPNQEETCLFDLSYLAAAKNLTAKNKWKVA